MKTTRQQILDVSLDLFSQKGFSAVSIMDICRQVQIKESSIYYHFTNKQAILDELLHQFEEKSAGLMSTLEQAMTSLAAPAEGNFYQTVCDIFFEDYLMDPFCNKLMRLLQIEKLHNSEIQKIYDHWMFEKPLAFQEQIFARLMEASVIPPGDSRYLALRYYAPVYFFAERWLFCGILSEKRKNAFRTEANCHIKKFFSEIGRDAG